jgi:hypothetical protein
VKRSRGENSILFRVVDPHLINADPDPDREFFLIADPDPVSESRVLLTKLEKFTAKKIGYFLIKKKNIQRFKT